MYDTNNNKKNTKTPEVAMRLRRIVFLDIIDRNSQE